MNLYLISQDVNDNYDTYDSAVVAAENEDEARLMHPSGDFIGYGGDWASPEHVEVRLIGRATNDITEPQVICSSFNAG